MRNIIFVISLMAAALSACSGSDRSDRQKIEDAVRRDVSKVADAPEGSMQRERAVLAIRVREHALRSSGYEDEADQYIEMAGNLLIDSLKIIDAQ